MPVRAFGTDADGNVFRQIACTLDLSVHGARIMGLHDVQIGQKVTLEYKKNKVRFTVKWVGEKGTPRQRHVGLRMLDEDKRLTDMDELLLTGEYVDEWSAERPA